MPPDDRGAALRVLIDADNVSAGRITALLSVLAELSAGVSLVAGGRREALRSIPWPPGTGLLEQAGWQAADLALASAYVPDELPLILVTGDGDFALLAARHPGAVLVVSGAPSGRLRHGTTVVDPATEGTAPITAWLHGQGL